MPISPYIKKLREKIGHATLLLPSVSAIIIDGEGRVLLHRSSDDGHWYTIGGAIDPGEQPADAVVREVREETGLVVIPQKIISVQTSPVVTYPNGDQAIYVATTFLCRVVGGKLEIGDDESLELRYFSIGELPDLRPDQLLRVEVALRDGADAYFEPPSE